MVDDMDKMMIDRQRISELADGRLQGEAFAQAVEAAVCDEDARATWHAYHLVGDTLRSAELARCDVQGNFMARLQARLQAEGAGTFSATASSVVAAELTQAGAWDRSGATRQSDTEQRMAQLARSSEAANATVYRWRTVAALATVAAVSVLGWSLLRSGAGDTAPALASVAPPSGLVRAGAGAAPANAAAASEQSPSAVMIRDPNLDALLAAHKQFGGTSALQAPAGFLRNATFDGAGR
jgi:sigma-E factor negative regulatory protein RseA